MTALPELERLRASSRRTVAMVLPLLAASLLASCASSSGNAAERKAAALERFPETVEAGIARAETFKACSSMQAHEVVARPRTDGRVPPTLVASCIPTYPQDLQALGFVARCDTTFDIGSDGAPVNLLTGCRTWNDGMLDDPDPLTPVANAMFETVAANAVAAMRFVPLDEEVDGAERAGIAQPFVFAFEDQLPLIREQAQPSTSEGAPE